MSNEPCREKGSLLGELENVSGILSEVLQLLDEFNLEPAVHANPQKQEPATCGLNRLLEIADTLREQAARVLTRTGATLSKLR